MRSGALAAFGWLVRVRTQGVTGTPFGWLASTEGFIRRLGHAELEIAVPMPPRTAQGILCSAAVLIDAAGVTFSPGRKAAGVLGNGFDVEFVWSWERSSKRLRMILPDGHNQTARHLMTGKMARQWEVQADYVPPSDDGKGGGEVPSSASS